MRVFFDNCTSPVLASPLHGYVSHAGHAAHHIKDLPCGRHAMDVEWIRFLSTSSEAWIVITGDARIFRNKPERAAFRAAGLRGLILARSYQKTPLHQVASTLIWRWPDIERLMSIVGGPALYELPVTRGGRISSLPL